MDLDEAVARIAEIEGQMVALTVERDALAGERDMLTGHAADLESARASLESRLRETAGAHDAASGDLAEVRVALSAASERGLAYLRRALLAEQAGQIVPELVVGGDEESLAASVE